MAKLICGCDITKEGNLKFCQTHAIARDLRAFVEKHLHTFHPVIQNEARLLLSGQAKQFKPETVQRGCGCKVTYENSKILEAKYCSLHEDAIKEKQAPRLVPTLTKHEVEGMHLERKAFEEE